MFIEGWSEVTHLRLANKTGVARGTIYRHWPTIDDLIVDIFDTCNPAPYAERVTMDVGFYYIANSVGQLVGTVLSRFTYQIGELSLCLDTATVMIGLGWLGTSQLKVP